MKHRILPVILSGGSGTRLWPVSTATRPKQFHSFGARKALIAETAERVRGDSGALSFAPPVVISGAAHAELVAGALAGSEVAPAAIVLEPVARNTAAAAAVAAALAREIEPGALVLLMPSDHVIADRAAFLATIERAAPFARDRIVTFGITPARPETGYGYIKRGAELGAGVFAIEGFREKPNAATAREYIEHGGYAWNAGIFLFNPDALLEEFAGAPEIRDAALEALAKARRQGPEIRLDETAFARAPSQSLDIAVMERTKRGAVAPCEIGWADLGAWDEIWRLAAKDAAGNAAHGRVAVADGANNYLRAEGVKLIVAGVSDLIVIATPDAVVVLPRARAQDVKRLRELSDEL